MSTTVQPKRDQILEGLGFTPAGIKRIKLGPGPGMCEERALLGQMTNFGHMDPVYLQMTDDTNSALRTILETSNRVTFAGSGTGSAGIEAIFLNAFEPGDKVLVCSNGVFGARAIEMAKRAGLAVNELRCEMGRAVDPDEVEEALRAAGNIRGVFFVAAETSTGVRTDIQPIINAVRSVSADIVVAVDAVTAVAGLRINMDVVGLDVLSAGTQKCLGVPTGLFPSSYSPRVVERMLRRTSPQRTWAFDFRQFLPYLGQEAEGAARRYHHTPPTSLMGALYIATKDLLAEGMPAVYDRHAACGRAFRTGIRALGLEPRNPDAVALPMLTAVGLPDGVAVSEFLARARNRNVEFGGGLDAWASNTVRVGLMGPGAKPEYVRLALGTIGEILRELEKGPDPKIALDAADRELTALGFGS